MQPKSWSGTPESRATSRLAIHEGTLRETKASCRSLPPARDDVVARLELLQQPGNVGRVVLAVAVDRDQDLAAGQVERGRQGRGLAAIAPQEDDPDVLGIARPGSPPASRPCRRSSRRRRRSARSEVAGGRKHRVELGMERLDVVDFVVDRNQDRQIELGRVESEANVSR